MWNRLSTKLRNIFKLKGTHSAKATGAKGKKQVSPPTPYIQKRSAIYSAVLSAFTLRSKAERTAKPREGGWQYNKTKGEAKTFPEMLNLYYYKLSSINFGSKSHFLCYFKG